MKVSLVPVSIVIPNYNGYFLLKDSLPTVIACLMAYSGGGEIIVVDDCSSDHSVELLEKSFPSVKCVRHEQNMGFAEAVHTGVNNSKNDFIFLLNSDVIPEENLLEPLVFELQNDEEIFSISPKIFEATDTVSQYSFNLRRLTRGQLKRESVNFSRLIEGTACHLYSSGGSMVFRKAYFLRLGGFCEIFKPFYFEDFDLGVRAWRRGWKVVYKPSVNVLHPSGATIRNTVSAKKVKLVKIRNRYFIHWIHLPLATLTFFYIPGLLIKFIGYLITADFINLKAFFAAAYCLPEVVKCRKENEKYCDQNLEKILDKIRRCN